jgi:hypothetical protein
MFFVHEGSTLDKWGVHPAPMDEATNEGTMAMSADLFIVDQSYSITLQWHAKKKVRTNAPNLHDWQR